MLNNILPLGRDELIAVILAIISLFFAPLIPVIATTLNIVGSLALIYLLICVVMRKYETIVKKYHRPIIIPDETSKHK